MKENIEVLKKAAKSKRFKNLKLLFYRDQIDLKAQKQFAAITIVIEEDKQYYIAYRGTDTNLVGWKEDFNMSFLKVVPAQEEALDYLLEVADKTKGELRIGGHSKGGNLAVYAATYAPTEIQDRIVTIYNHDGPGLLAEYIASVNYERICKKIKNIVPESSVIGMLFEHGQSPTIIQSEQKGLLQHDPFSWQVKRDHFVTLKQMDTISQLFNEVIKKWIDKLETYQIEQFVELLYQVILATKATTWTDLLTQRPQKLGLILKSFKEIDESTKQVVNDMMMELAKIVTDEVKSSLFSEKKLVEFKSSES